MKPINAILLLASIYCLALGAGLLIGSGIPWGILFSALAGFPLGYCYGELTEKE